MLERAKGIIAERRPIGGNCPECGSESLAHYEVLSEGGWFQVVKCQDCLASVERTRWARHGHVRRDHFGIAAPSPDAPSGDGR